MQELAQLIMLALYVAQYTVLCITARMQLVFSTSKRARMKLQFVPS